MEQTSAGRAVSFVPVAVLIVAVIVAAGAGVYLGQDGHGGGQAGERADEYIARGMVCEDKSHGPQLWLGADALMDPPRCAGSDLVGWNWPKVKGVHELGTKRWGRFVVIGAYDPAKDAMTLTRPAIPEKQYKGDMLDRTHAEDGGTLATPCKTPRGGWRVLNPALTNQQSLDRTAEAAATRPDYGSLWVDQSLNPVKEVKSEDDEMLMNDPTKLILNVAVTGDPAQAEADIRKTWGGALCVSRQKHTDRELRKIQDAVANRPGMLSAGGGHDSVELEVVWDDGSLQSELDKQYGPGIVKVTSAIRPLQE